jgi:hypothetical protein
MHENNESACNILVAKPQMKAQVTGFNAYTEG